MSKKKHKTPKKLDYLFERHVVTKSNYKEFWEGYWGERTQRDRNRYVDRFASELIEEQVEKGKPGKSGTVTFSIEAARQQAEMMGGYVVRRNKKGRFSKTGKQFQAVVRRKRG